MTSQKMNVKSKLLLMTSIVIAAVKSAVSEKKRLWRASPIM